MNLVKKKKKGIKDSLKSTKGDNHIIKRIKERKIKKKKVPVQFLMSQTFVLFLATH